MSVNCEPRSRARHRRPASGPRRGARGSRRLNLESLECRNLLTAGLELPTVDLWGEAPEMLLRTVAAEQSVGWTARTAEIDEAAWLVDAKEATYAPDDPEQVFLTAWFDADADDLYWQAEDEAFGITQVWDFEPGDDEMMSVQIKALADDFGDADDWSGGEFRMTALAMPMDDAGEWSEFEFGITALPLDDADVDDWSGGEFSITAMPLDDADVDDWGDGEFRITAMPMDDAGVDDWTDSEFRITVVADGVNGERVDGEITITSTDDVVTTTGVEILLLHNPDNSYDVNGDGLVSALDVLIVVNYINTGGSGPLQLMSAATESAVYFVDVDGDGEVGPLDVVRLMNLLNGSGAEAIDAATPAGVAPLWQSPTAPQMVHGPVQDIVGEIESGQPDLESGRYVALPKASLIDESIFREEDRRKLYDGDAIFSDDADWLLPDVL